MLQRDICLGWLFYFTLQQCSSSPQCWWFWSITMFLQYYSETETDSPVLSVRATSGVSRVHDVWLKGRAVSHRLRSKLSSTALSEHNDRGDDCGLPLQGSFDLCPPKCGWGNWKTDNLSSPNIHHFFPTFGVAWDLKYSGFKRWSQTEEGCVWEFVNLFFQRQLRRLQVLHQFRPKAKCTLAINHCNFNTLLFWKTTILSSKLQCSTAAVVSREKTSCTSKRDSWSQLKCNLSNPVIWRSKGFPLSVSSLSRLCCGPVWASVCACVCMCIYMVVCLHAWVQSEHNLGGWFRNRGISFSWRLFGVKRRIMGKMSRQKDPNLLKMHWETSYSGSLNMKPQGICLDHLIFV